MEDQLAVLNGDVRKWDGTAAAVEEQSLERSTLFGDFQPVHMVPVLAGPCQVPSSREGTLSRDAAASPQQQARDYGHSHHSHSNLRLKDDAYYTDMAEPLAVALLS